MQNEEITTKRNIWQSPWGYRESAAIALGVLFTGIMLEMFTNGYAVSLPTWPFNLITGFIFILIVIVIFIIFRQNNAVRWLSGIPASIGAICLFTLLVLAMGLIPQQKGDIATLPLGMSNILHSWQFILSSIYLLLTLSLVTLRRTIPFRKSTPAFLLNHFGLWLIVFAISIGSSDLERYQMILEEGKATNIGYSEQKEAVEFPFSIELIDFHIDEFPAKLALAEQQTSKISSDIKNNTPLIEKGKEYKLGTFVIKVIEYFPSAIKTDSAIFQSTTDSSATTAAKIRVYDKSNGKNFEGWVSSGSPGNSPNYLTIGDKYFLALLLPSPKRFSSRINIASAKTKISNIKIEVNKPYKYNKWKLYQTGFDEQMGKFSKISIVEAVHDPWIPVVYTGIFMLLAGALYMFWIGKEIKK